MENGKKTVDSTVHDSAQSMKDSNRVGCSIREHLKNVRQRTDLNFCNNPRLSRAALRRQTPHVGQANSLRAEIRLKLFSHPKKDLNLI